MGGDRYTGGEMTATEPMGCRVGFHPEQAHLVKQEITELSL